MRLLGLRDRIIRRFSAAFDVAGQRVPRPGQSLAHVPLQRRSRVDGLQVIVGAAQSGARGEGMPKGIHG